MEDEGDLAVELKVICREYEWFLREEVKKILNELRNLIMETLKSFNNKSDNSESLTKPEKFLLACPNGIHQSKCMVTLSGDLITEADLGIRLQKQPVIIYQTRIHPDVPWRLQQIQDAGNHLERALSSIDNNAIVSSSSSSSLSSGAQVLSFIDDLIGLLKLGRESICLPKIQMLDLIKSSNSKVFRPALPQDTVAIFFVQAQKLILSVHHLSSHSQSKVDLGIRYQLECSVPWLNDALFMFTAALHKCQQLKDKMAVFAGYEAQLIRLQANRDNSSRLKSAAKNSSDLSSVRATNTSFAAEESESSRTDCSETEVTSF